MEEEKMENNNENLIIALPDNENSAPALPPPYQNETENYLNSFPPGYYFKPKDDELILYYLQRKINNLPLRPNRIHQVDIYKTSPKKLSVRFPKANEREWYFFSPRDKKYRNGTRPNRAAGKGYWKATGADKPIKNKSNEVIGYLKTLVYYKGPPQKGDKRNWIMKEYRVTDNYPVPAAAPSSSAGHNSMQLDDCVLYKVYRKNPQAPKKDSKDKDLCPKKEVNEDQPVNSIQANHEDQSAADHIQHNYEEQSVDQVSEQHYGGDQILYNGFQQQQHHQVQPADQTHLLYQDEPADQILEQHYGGDLQNFYNGAHHQQQYQEQHQQIWSTPPNENFSNNIVMYQNNNVMLCPRHYHRQRYMPTRDQLYLPNPIRYVEDRDWYMEDLPDLGIDYPETLSRGGGNDLINHQYLQSPASNNNWNPPAPEMQQPQQQQQDMPASTSNLTNSHPDSPPEN